MRSMKTPEASQHKCPFCDAYLQRIEIENLYGTRIYYECGICDFKIKEKVILESENYSQKDGNTK